MRVCVINDSELPEKIDTCDIVFLMKNPIPKLVKSNAVRSTMWLKRELVNWVFDSPCSHCIGSYFEFSEDVSKLTKYKFEILQNKEFNIITENEVCKFWIGDDYNTIPKNCDVIIVNDEPDERTITQTRKKTNGNIELATKIKEQKPKVTIYPGSSTTKLECKKNCITKFATVANIIYFDI